MAATETLTDRLARWRKVPDEFVREMIGAEPDDWQVYALRQIALGKRVSVAACHGVGKDTLAAWVVLWAMYCWPRPKIPCTAPTAHQLYDLLWSEIAKWRNGIPTALRNLTDLKSDRFEWVNDRATWFAVARTARKENSEALQGFHAEVIVVVVDEASGVPDIIFEVLEGALTGAFAIQLLIGNPTQPAGFFAESHRSDRRFVRMRVMAAHALKPGEKVPPGVWASYRPTKVYVEAMRLKYGEDSNVYRVRVLGLFPRSSDDQAIPMEWVEQAAMRDVPKDHWLKSDQRMCIGLDVARFGDDATAVTVRQGSVVMGAWTWHGNDTAQTKDKVLKLAQRLAPLTVERDSNGNVSRPGYTPAILVDGVGVGGGVVDELRKVEGLTVIDVQVGNVSADPDCHRKRDSLWWRARLFYQKEKPAIAPGSTDKRLTSIESWTPQNPHIDSDVRDRMTGELATPKYGLAPDGKIKIESKSEVKDRLGGSGGSPDVADSHNLTFNNVAWPKPEAVQSAYLRRQTAPTQAWTGGF